MALAYYYDTALYADSGRAYAGVRIEALIGGVPAQLYRDESGTPASQITTNANGFFKFWVEEGEYSLRYSLGGVTLVTQDGVEIFNLVKEVELASDEGAEGVGVSAGVTLQAYLDALNPGGAGNAMTRDQAGTTYTLLQSDNGYILNFTSGTSVTVTVPPGLLLPYTVGISQGGLGQITLSPGSGVTVTEPDGNLTTETQGVICSLIAFSTNDYRLSGRLV